MKGHYVDATPLLVVKALDGQAERELDLFLDMMEEVNRSVELHGEQDLPMGSGPQWKSFADGARTECDRVTAEGTVTWRHIITEEMWEAMAEEDWPACRTELIQTAAMIFKCIANGDAKHDS